jgi:hypothetical protein
MGAIRAGELYVITHAEGLEPLRRRFQRLEEALRQGSGARRPSGVGAEGREDTQRP